jgi:hypothetical protein
MVLRSMMVSPCTWTCTLHDPAHWLEKRVFGSALAGVGNRAVWKRDATSPKSKQQAAGPRTVPGENLDLPPDPLPGSMAPPTNPAAAREIENFTDDWPAWPSRAPPDQSLDERC